jgi:transposase
MALKVNTRLASCFRHPPTPRIFLPSYRPDISPVIFLFLKEIIKLERTNGFSKTHFMTAFHI